jgi:hypothetical protein
MKCFVTIGDKQLEISPYIKEWADKTVSHLEQLNVPNECIIKVIVGTIATKQHLHQYCNTHNLDFLAISKIVYK